MYMPVVFVAAFDRLVDGGTLDVGLTVSYVVGVGLWRVYTMGVDGFLKKRRFVSHEIF